MRTITWGAIGCGDVCERKSGPPLYQVPGCRLAGVTRRDAAKGRNFAQRHGACHFYDDAASLLADPTIDVVYIATHPDSHADYTVQTAAAGKHVLVEKEMAVDAEQCTAMIAACAAAGVSLAVAFYRRCYPSILTAQTLINEGAIGQVQELTINDQFPLSHRLDLAHFLCGPMAEARVDEEDLATGSHAARGLVLSAIAERQGTRCRMNIGWQETDLIERLHLIGSQGSLMVDDLKGGRLTLIQAGQREEIQVPGLPYTHWGLIENVAAHLRDGSPLACDGAEGRRSQVIEDMVKRLVPGGPSQTVQY